MSVFDPLGLVADGNAIFEKAFEKKDCGGVELCRGWIGEVRGV